MPTKIKVSTVKRVIEGKSSVTSIAKELGVARKTIYSWLKVYKSAARRNKKTCLATKYIKGSAHPKEYKHTLEQKLVRLVKTDPTLSVSKIAEKLNAGHHAVYNLLTALNLTTEDSRLAYCNIYAHPGIFDPEIKQSAVRKVVSSEGRVTDVAHELRVSRKTIYAWLREYKENGVVKNNYLSGFDHPRSLGQEAEAKILSKVVKAPELSIHALATQLNYSSHAIFNILNKNLLTHKNARIIYSQAQIARVSEEPQKAGLSERVKSVFETFTPNLAPAPPPKFFSIVKTFFISSGLTSIVTFGSLLWVSVITGGGSFSAGVGLTFAFIALAAGTFFFLYSLKYYITTSLLLSFSNREDKNKINLKTPGMNADLDGVHISKYPFISVHIPFYNEKNVVERSIKAATNFDYPAYEVILCDDSTDETTEKIRKYQETCLFKGESLKITKGEGWTLTEVEVRPGVTLKHLHRTTRSGYKGGALALALKLVDPRTEFVSIFDADFVPYGDSLNLFLKYFKVANGMEENYTKGNLAAVQGYQWHVLNKSENWVTKGVRTEYAGSYVIERSAIEIYKGLKQISGSVYMIRRDVLNQIGWGTSITEDFELTLKLYDAGYKVAYTPYIQAPAECVSTLKRMVRQRMRWAEGHSFNVKTMAWKLLRNPKLSFAEKFEFTYLMPYYLQAFFFLVGTFCWFISEAVFKVRLPFWTELWGWSMVLTNMVSLPLMNFVGMFMEESDKKDYSGLASFVALSYIIVPFQAYAAVKGFLEKKEGPWFRTPKTGHITDSYIKSTFFRFIQGFIPKGAEVHQDSAARYLALSTANNRFDKFNIATGRGRKWKARGFLAVLLIISNLLISMAPSVPYFMKPSEVQAQSFDTLNKDQNNTQESKVLPQKNFEKGVLAINSNKQEFLQAEEVYIQMASLDELGHTLCNSDLKLEIEYPGVRVDEFTTNDGGIVNSTTCGDDNVTDNPDYFVKFRPVNTGVYVLKLTNTENGNQATNSFNVVESQSISIERVSATRINPFKSDYQMTVKFKANEDTNQTFKDTIPEGFNIVNSEEKIVSMQVDLKRGQEKSFTYRYQAPEVSPELYTINGWQIASDAARVANTTGNWNSTTTWSGLSVPGSGDTCTINAAVTVTVNIASAACGSITILAPNTANGITISSTNTLTTGALITTVPASTSRTTTIAVGAGSLTASSIALKGSTSSRYTLLTISTGSVTVSGDITTAGTASRITFTGGGTLNAGGTFMSGTQGTFTPSTGTINFNKAGNQAISPFAYTFNNVTLSGSGAKDTTNATINKILSVEGTATTTGTIATYGADATLQYKGSGAQTTGTEFPATWTGTGGVIIANTSGSAVTLGADEVINAPLTINTNAILNTSAADNHAVSLGGNFVNNGTFTANASNITISGTTTQSIAGFTTTGSVTMTKTGGTATFTGNVGAADLTINGSGGTLNLGTSLTHTFTGTWTRTDGTLNGGSSTFNLAGSMSGTGGTFTAGTGTVVLNGAAGSTQTLVDSLTFYNLTASPANARTIAFTDGTTQTVTHNLTMAGSNGQLLTLQRTGSTSQWNVDATGATISLDYLSVSYSNSVTCLTITHSTNGGNNVNWDFNANGCLINSTQYSFQRKTWYDGTRYWKTYATGSQIQFWYSATGASWTQNTSATITVSTSDFSIEADTTDLFIAYTNGFDVEALEAHEANYPGTSWGWKAAATKVYDGSSSTDAYSYPTITRDTDTKVWIMVTHHTGSNYIIKTLQSTSTNDIAAWGSVSSVDTSTNSNKYGVISALASGSMYAVWIDGATIEGSKYTAGGGGGTIDKSIAVTADDGTEMVYGASKSFYTTDPYNSSGIYFGSPTNYEYNTFLRFTGVTITGTVTSSYIKVYAHDDSVADSGAGYPKVNIYGVKQDNPAAPTTYTEFDNLALTSAVVTWDGQAWSTDSQYQSGSLNSIFQEISDNFTISNDAVIVQLRNGSNPSGYSNYQNTHDLTGNAAYVATLHIEYTVGGWDAAATIDTGTSGMSTNLSALSDASRHIQLSYIDSSGHTVYREYTTSWQAATTLDSNSGNTYTSISLNTADSSLYVFWIRDVAGTKHIYYKNSANWAAAATDWHTGTNLTNFSSNISGSGTTMIFGEWTSDAGEPYTVNWDMIAVPENLWFFFSLGIIVPFYMRKKRKKNSATITRQYIK